MTPGTLQGPIRRGKPFQNQKNMTGKKPGNHFICFSKNPSQKNNLSKKNKHHMTNWQLPSFLTKGTCKGTTGSPCCRWWIGSQNRWIHLTHLCGHGATPKWPTSLKVNQGNKKNKTKIIWVDSRSSRYLFSLWYNVSIDIHIYTFICILWWRIVLGIVPWLRNATQVEHEQNPA